MENATLSEYFQVFFAYIIVQDVSKDSCVHLSINSLQCKTESVM